MVRTSGALHQILDSEGCRVRVAADVALLIAELKTGEWSLVIANAALIGVDTASPMALILAATFPERVSALVLFEAYARMTSAPGYEI